MSKNNSNVGIRPLPMVAKAATRDAQQYRVRHKWLPILLILTGPQVLSLPVLQAATGKGQIDDRGITSAVERALDLEKGVFPDDVDVSTSQGIVTLSGPVNNLLAKERAVRIAESIRGVRGVIDRISVTPASRPDADIRKDIQAALRQDPATESYRVAVSVQKAVATLTGSVGSHAEKQLADRIARGVKGVKEVHNDVAVNDPSKRTDSEIAADIKARLQWDIWINGNLIDADVRNGKVTLAGIVGSAIAKVRAFDDSWVNGVIAVDDSQVEVAPLAKGDARRRLKYAIRPDSDIKQAVQAAFRLDPRVAAFSPDVAVEGGEVVLGGIVGNLKAKTSAERDARDTVGVSGVDSHLKVRPGGQATDAEMKEQLNAVIRWDPLLDGSKMTVDVVNRVALLSGSVTSAFRKAEAQDVASRTKGVVSVHNELKVEPRFYVAYYEWPDSYPYVSPYADQLSDYASGMFGPELYLTDERIKKNIESAFFWSPFVHSAGIKVVVDGGVATLTGTVGTSIAWREADRDARGSGATRVINRVKVKSGGWWW